jgi:hypothetical protein
MMRDVKWSIGFAPREDGQSESDRVIREVECQINRGHSFSPPYRWKPRRAFCGGLALTERGRAYSEDEPEPVSGIVTRENITGQDIRKTAEG